MLLFPKGNKKRRTPPLTVMGRRPPKDAASEEAGTDGFARFADVWLKCSLRAVGFQAPKLKRVFKG